MKTLQFIISVSTVLVAFLHGMKVNAETVTVYIVDDPPPLVFPGDSASIEQLGSAHVSALGPGENGMTRYAVEEVHAGVVIHYATKTETALAFTFTETYTIQEGATQIFRSDPRPTGTADYFGIVESCVLDPTKGTGECVKKSPELHNAEVAFQAEVPSTTRTYTGRLRPVATLDSNGGAAPGGTTGGPTPTSNPGKNGGIPQETAGMNFVALVCASVVTGVWMVLA